MSIVTNYKKEMEQIEDLWKTKHQEYMSKINELKAEAEKYCKKYNDQICVINADRYAMRDEIKCLYDFLIKFGNIGERITPFDYVTEDSERVNMDGELPLDAEKRQKSAGERVLENLFIATSVTLELFTPAILIAALYKHFKEKKIYEEYLLKFENAKNEYGKSIESAKDVIKTYKLLYEISNIYREIIATVRDSIKYIIMPELSDITAFLYADAIANKFTYDQDFSMGVIPSDIKEFENTRYNEHYLFVKNSFEFYKIISEFFTKQILTQLKDCKISQQESDEFTAKINEIKQKNDELKQLAVFNKE